MSIIDDSIAIAEKETKLALRYKVPFFTSSLVGLGFLSRSVLAEEIQVVAISYIVIPCGVKA